MLRSIATGVLVHVILLPLLLCLASVGAAQTVRSEGIIRGVKPGFLKVTTKEGDWVLKVDAAKENIVLSAEAEPSWLQRGMLVRFEVNLDQQGLAQAPVEHLTVFTPRKGYGVGVVLDQPGSTRGSSSTRNRRSRSSRRGTAKPRGGQADEADGETGDDDSPDSKLPVYLVAGRIERVGEGQIIVAAGRDRVVAMLADNVKIKVDAQGDYSLAQEGDEIDFTARQVGSGQAIAKRIKITADVPLQGKRALTVGEQKRRRATRARTGVSQDLLRKRD